MAEIDNIIMNGPYAINKQHNLPKGVNKHSFSVTMMHKKINYGDNFPRGWLIYSESSSKMFCFVAKFLASQINDF